jgi:hypothetical protein
MAATKVMKLVKIEVKMMMIDEMANMHDIPY